MVDDRTGVESPDWLQQLVDQIPAFLWVIDRDLVVRRIEGGKAMLEWLHRDRLIGMSMEAISRMGSSAEDVALSMDMHRRALHGAPGQYRATWGGVVLEARIRPLRDRQGAIVGVVGVGIDVTEQTQLHAKLLEQEERFRAIVEQSTDLVSIFDDDGRVVYASPSHRRVLGYRGAERTSIDPWSLIHPEDVAYVRAELAALPYGRAVPLSRTVRVKARNGEWRTLAVTLTDLRRKPAVGGVVVRAEDVTERRELEAQLQQAQKLEALGRLAGGVAHDFNNVLAAIIGYAQLLLDEVADEQRGDVASIIEAAERATSITKQLLAFSRKEVPEAERIDLVTLVHQASGMLRALLPATITLHISPARDSEPIEVMADRGRLEQVVLNLAVNARDALPAGGSVWIDVAKDTTPRDTEVAVLRVRDDGMGMSSQTQQRVFEPFFTTKEPGKGTGLGLATVYGIVRQYGGTITIDSAPDKGTTVTVTLPKAAPGAGVVAAPPQAVDVARVGRVLVVDDETSVRDVTARLLVKAGFEVLTAVDARSAIELMTRAGPFDLVITDSAMPGMRGEDLAAKLVQIQPGLPVILMSGYVDPAVRPDAGSVALFIQKPFTGPALLADVQRVLGHLRRS